MENSFWAQYNTIDELCNIILHFENIFYIMQNRMDSYFTNRIPKTTVFLWSLQSGKSIGAKMSIKRFQIQ